MGGVHQQRHGYAAALGAPDDPDAEEEPSVEIAPAALELAGRRCMSALRVDLAGRLQPVPPPEDPDRASFSAGRCGFDLRPSGGGRGEAGW